MVVAVAVRWVTIRKTAKTGLLGEFLQLLKLLDDESPAGEVDQTLGAEFIQRGCNSLPCGTDQEGNFLVRKVHCDGDNSPFDFPELLCVSDEKRGDPLSDILEDHLGNTLLEPPEPKPNAFRNFKIKLRLHLEERFKVFPPHCANDGLVQRLGKFPAGFFRSRKRQFPEDFAWSQNVQDHLFAVLSNAGNLHMTFLQEKDGLRGLIGKIEWLLGADSGHGGHLIHPGHGCVIHPLKDVEMLQIPEL